MFVPSPLPISGKSRAPNRKTRPERVTTPFKFLVWDYNEVEHAFKDPDLEAERLRLVQAANDFLYKEAINGFTNRHISLMRDAGYTAGEDDLVQTAKDKGYDLDAMRADVHPAVAELDQRIEAIARASGADRLRAARGRRGGLVD